MVAGGTAIGVVNSVLGGSRSVLLLPLLLKVWSPATVGLWLVFRAIFAWFGLGDLGFTDPVQILFSRWDPADEASGQRLFNTALLVFAAIGALLGGAAALSGGLLPWAEMLHLTPDLASQAQTAFIWGGAAMGIWIVGRLPDAIMIGLRQSPRAGAYRMAALLGSIAAIVACLLLRASLAHTFVAAIYAEISVAAVQLFELCRRYRCFRPHLRLHRHELSCLSAPSGSFLILKLTGLVFAQSGVLVLSHFLGPSSVTGYAVTLRLAVLWYTPASIGTVLLQPEVAPFWNQAQLRFESLSAQFESGWLLSIVIGSVLAFGFLGSARPVAHLFIHGDQLSSWPTVAAFAVLVFLMTVYTYGCTWVHSAMQIRMEARLGWALVAVNLALAIWLVPRWGAFGAATAGLLGYALTYAWYLPWKAARLVAQASAAKALMQMLVSGLLVTATVAAFAVLAAHSRLSYGIALAALPAIEIALALWAWKRLFSETHRAMVRRLLRLRRCAEAPS